MTTGFLTDAQYRTLNPSLPCAHGRAHRARLAEGATAILSDDAESAERPPVGVRAWQRINERFARKGRRWRAIVRRHPHLAL